MTSGKTATIHFRPHSATNIPNTSRFCQPRNSLGDLAPEFFSLRLDHFSGDTSETVFTNSLVGTKTGGRPLDGRLEISNNRAERSIKPFVMGRKNFLFANVPRGAETSAIIYSLIETAKENGLDPYRYLTWLMREAPKLDMRADEQVARLMPVNAPEECRVRKSV